MRGLERALGRAALAAALLLAGCDEPVPAAGAAAPGHADVLARPASAPLPARFGVGRPASPSEIAALDIDVGPDGVGLPPGSGTVDAGAAVYAARCASCHGVQGEGTPAGDRLVPDPEAPGFPDAEGLEDGTRAIGSYWPWATTLFDYVRRSMPQDRPGTLTDPEVYAVTAWILWRNGLVEEDAVIDASSLPAVMMPARDRFVPDDRLTANRVK
ncbi:MAG: cytochrome c [Gemmatimonadetes bacterium]|nr:cytochrome c [Gemmatimonadota bacterium]